MPLAFALLQRPYSSLSVLDKESVAVGALHVAFVVCRELDGGATAVTAAGFTTASIVRVMTSEGALESERIQALAVTLLNRIEADGSAAPAVYDALGAFAGSWLLATNALQLLTRFAQGGAPVPFEPVVQALRAHATDVPKTDCVAILALRLLEVQLGRQEPSAAVLKDLLVAVTTALLESVGAADEQTERRLTETHIEGLDEAEPPSATLQRHGLAVIRTLTSGRDADAASRRVIAAAISVARAVLGSPAEPGMSGAS